MCGSCANSSPEAVRHLRTILSLILTNSEARKLLSDFSVVGRDLLAKGAVKAAETLRPTEEQLAKVDEPAPQDEFPGHKGGTGEGPAVKIPGTDAHLQHEPGDDTKFVSKDDERPLGETIQSGKEAAEQTSAHVVGQASQLKGDVHEGVQQQAEKVQKEGYVDPHSSVLALLELVG